MNGELELVEDRSCVMGTSVSCAPSVGAPLALRARTVRKKRTPHISPGEPWMRLLKHCNKVLRHLIISVLVMSGLWALRTTLTFLDLDFFEILPFVLRDGFS